MTSSLQSIGGPANLLGQPLSSVDGLRALPWLERLTLRRAFKGEQMRLGSFQEWLGRSWELRLAAVKETIYKVAIESRALDHTDAVELSTAVALVLHRVCGEPIRQGDTLFIWDADDGNAVLQLAYVGGERRVMLFLTSSIARSFVPS